MYSEVEKYSFPKDPNTMEEGAEIGLELVISQSEDDLYGGVIWPCSEILSDFLWKKKDLIVDKTVLELGSGCGLSGLLCAAIGAKKVYLSDSVHFDQVFDNLKHNIKENKLIRNTKIIKLEWGIISKELTNLKDIDIIIGSDTFYERDDFEPLISTIAFLLHQNPKASFIATYQERSAKRTIQPLLEHWGLVGNLLESSPITLRKNGEILDYDILILTYQISKI